MLFCQLKEKAEAAEAIGGTLKFEVGDLVVYIDGSGNSNIVSQDDGDADCTISTTAEVLIDLKNGDLNPMMAVMGGKIKIGGDMGLAMKIQTLLG